MHLVIISAVLLLLAVAFAWQATRYILSPITFTVGLFLLFYTGGLYYFFTEGHSLIPLYIAIGAFCYAAGAIVAASRVHFRPRKELQDFREAPFESLFPFKKAFFISLSLAGIASILLVVYYFYDTGIPLLSEWPSKARTLGARGRGIFIRSGITYLPLLLTIAYLYHKFAKRLSSRLLALLLLAGSLSFIILLGGRGTFSFYLIPFMLVYGVVCREKDLKKVYVLCLIFLISALVIQYTLPSYQDIPLRDAVGILLGRLTMQQAEAFDYIVYDLAEQKDFFMGQAHWTGIKGILSTLRIIPHGSSFGEIMFYKKTGNTSIPFTLSTTTFGDLYLDFGLAGVCIGMFLYGFIAESLYIRMLRGRKDFFLFPIISYCQYIIISAHWGGGFFGVIANNGLSTIVIALLIVLLYILVVLPTERIPLRILTRAMDVHGQTGATN